MLTKVSYSQDGSDTKYVGLPRIIHPRNPCYAYIHVPMISEPWNITDRYHYIIRNITNYKTYINAIQATSSLAAEHHHAQSPIVPQPTGS